MIPQFNYTINNYGIKYDVTNVLNIWKKKTKLNNYIKDLNQLKYAMVKSIEYSKLLYCSGEYPFNLSKPTNLTHYPYDDFKRLLNPIKFIYSSNNYEPKNVNIGKIVYIGAVKPTINAILFYLHNHKFGQHNYIDFCNEQNILSTIKNPAYSINLNRYNYVDENILIFNIYKNEIYIYDGKIDYCNSYTGPFTLCKKYTFYDIIVKIQAKILINNFIKDKINKCFMLRFKKISNYLTPDKNWGNINKSYNITINNNDITNNFDAFIKENSYNEYNIMKLIYLYNYDILRLISEQYDIGTYNNVLGHFKVIK